MRPFTCCRAKSDCRMKSCSLWKLYLPLAVLPLERPACPAFLSLGELSEPTICVEGKGSVLQVSQAAALDKT